ncbi:DciA family protein [Candidatus Magnetaquicoccus inordinatus]|uniref:DciA family protein n=1 Tax=Candidatus Magnetaquicoccus inordinatus TaxID=2496818 RepID=UPI00102C7CBD|nr:DUF721 domain-containing protein [Candidatus Magnetaquicoccus inordinatus]
MDKIYHFKELMPISDLVQRVAGKLLEHPRSKGMQLYRQWYRAVGSTIADHSEPAHLANGVLTIRVDSPVWHQQLHLIKAELLAKLQPLLPDKEIRDLRFRQETLRMRQTRPPAATQPPVPFPEPHPSDLQRAEQWLQEVADPELRAVLFRLLLTYLTLKRNGQDPFSQGNRN